MRARQNSHKLKRDTEQMPSQKIKILERYPNEECLSKNFNNWPRPSGALVDIPLCTVPHTNMTNDGISKSPTRLVHKGISSRWTLVRLNGSLSLSTNPRGEIPQTQPSI